MPEHDILHFVNLIILQNVPMVTVDITKAIAVAESCEVSKQFRASIVKKWTIKDPRVFINRIPHCSIVFWEKNVRFLKTRYENMHHHPMFMGMEYSEDHARIRERMPLIMKDRDKNQPLAATFMDIGTDINFAALTRGLIEHVTTTKQVSLHLNHHVTTLEKQSNGQRKIRVEDRTTGKVSDVYTKFVFIGAGWAALTLLQKSGITERKWLWWFPVSGQRLMCTNPDIIAQHDAKVYGKASLWAPPMSVPHLDTRIIDGKKALLFGPYAWFTTKFLKNGSFFDLLKSLQWHNIIAMLGAWLHNFSLTKYLISQVIQRP